MTHPYASRFLDRATPPHILTLMLIAGVPALSLNVFLPALPAMSEHFRVSYGTVAATVPLALGANAILQMFIGPMSDRLGRRPVLLWAFAIFAAASAATAVAPNIETLLILRVIQSVSAAGMVLSRAIVRDMVPQAQAASMIGYVTMGMSVVPMIAPMLGGWLTERAGWQSNFWMLGLAGLAVLVLVWTDLGETHPGEGRSFRDQAREYPELFGSSRFWGYVAAALFSSGAFFAYLGGAPFVGSVVFGLSPAQVGTYFGAPALGYFAGNFVSGRYSVQVGIDRMMFWGAGLTLAGLALAFVLSIGGMHSPGVFFGFMTLVGLGNGMVLPNANAGMLSVRPHLAGTASGLGGAVTLGGGAVIAWFAGVLLGPDSTESSLLALQVACSALALVSIVFVMTRNRALPAPAE